MFSRVVLLLEEPLDGGGSSSERQLAKLMTKATVTLLLCRKWQSMHTNATLLCSIDPASI